MCVARGLEFALAGEFGLAGYHIAAGIAVEHRKRVAGLLAFLDIGKDLHILAGISSRIAALDAGIAGLAKPDPGDDQSGGTKGDGMRAFHGSLKGV